VIEDRRRLAFPRALAALTRCVIRTVVLLRRGAIRLPTARVDRVIGFADGSHARVYRETAIADAPNDDPAVLIVAFRLRGVHGWMHAAFRAESLLNTPLFVGFPGFVSKLWLADDDHEVYRGIYQWNDARLADAYVRALWWVLALVSEHSSIHYVVLPGLRRDDVLADPLVVDSVTHESPTAWWRPTVHGGRGTVVLSRGPGDAGRRSLAP
jgi:hypothetical protein